MADWTRRELSGTLTPLLLGACSAADGRPKTVLPRSEFTPGYARLERAGLLAPRIDALHEIYKDCRLCPRACGINRTRGGKGVCQLPTAPASPAPTPTSARNAPSSAAAAPAPSSSAAATCSANSARTGKSTTAATAHG